MIAPSKLREAHVEVAEVPPDGVSYWMDLTVLSSLVAWQGGRTTSPQRGLAPLALLGGMLRARRAGWQPPRTDSPPYTKFKTLATTFFSCSIFFCSSVMA